jgi:hypothetical protein
LNASPDKERPRASERQVANLDPLAVETPWTTGRPMHSLIALFLASPARPREIAWERQASSPVVGGVVCATAPMGPITANIQAAINAADRVCI